MNVEQELIKRVTPLKFQSENAFVIPNHSGITGNLDARNKLDARYGSGPRAQTLYRGTDFTGANPNKCLIHSKVLTSATQLFIGGRLMIPTVEYSIIGGAIGEFTMINVDIDDADYVVVVD